MRFSCLLCLLCVTAPRLHAQKPLIDVADSPYAIMHNVGLEGGKTSGRGLRYLLILSLGFCACHGEFIDEELSWSRKPARNKVGIKAPTGTYALKENQILQQSTST